MVSHVLTNITHIKWHTDIINHVQLIYTLGWILWSTQQVSGYNDDMMPSKAYCFTVVQMLCIADAYQWQKMESVPWLLF